MRVEFRVFIFKDYLANARCFTISPIRYVDGDEGSVMMTSWSESVIEISCVRVALDSAHRTKLHNEDEDVQQKTLWFSSGAHPDVLRMRFHCDHTFWSVGQGLWKMFCIASMDIAYTNAVNLGANSQWDCRIIRNFLSKFVSGGSKAIDDIARRSLEPHTPSFGSCRVFRRGKRWLFLEICYRLANDWLGKLCERWDKATR